MGFICLKCINDESLRKIAEDDALKAECHYCKRRGLGISMQEFAKIVDEPLRKYCKSGDFNNLENEQDGDQLDWFLQEELGIDCDPTADLIKILQEMDPADPRDGGEPFYDKAQNYLRRQGWPGEYHYNWEGFTSRIKHSRRFFDEEAKIQLAAILGEPDSTKASELPIIEIGLVPRINFIFRARLANSAQKVEEILKNSIVELGPPLAKDALAGRMNPAGISVFYGALSEEIAIAEVRPSVGGLVVVGCFKLLRKLRLLNLPQIDVGFTGSIFDLEYEDRVTRLSFLKEFHGLITRPIQPHEEVLEYIPTQAVAEYVANVLRLDGILYASSQLGTMSNISESDSGVILRQLSDSELSRCNIVLFGEAATVKKPPGEGKWIDLSTPPLILQEDKIKTVEISSVRYNYEPFYSHLGEQEIRQIGGRVTRPER